MELEFIRKTKDSGTGNCPVEIPADVIAGIVAETK